MGQTGFYRGGLAAGGGRKRAGKIGSTRRGAIEGIRAVRAAAYPATQRFQLVIRPGTECLGDSAHPGEGAEGRGRANRTCGAGGYRRLCQPEGYWKTVLLAIYAERGRGGGLAAAVHLLRVPLSAGRGGGARGPT